MTVGQALAEATESLAAAGSESARLDAEVLLAHVLRVDRSALLAHPEAPLGDGQRRRFEEGLARRRSGEPVAYIRGFKEFHGIALTVDPRVLIPRPETETLVELALARIRRDLTSAPTTAGRPPYLAWDIGTGSGAVAVAIAVELRRRRYGSAVHIVLSDVSADAMAVAVDNAVGHGVADLMTFACGDLVGMVPGPPRPVDLVVANLPYIPSAVVPTLPVAASFEPAAALDGGDDGLAVIRRLLPELPAVVVPGGVALLEIGSDQTAALREAAGAALPGWPIAIHDDLGGRPRVARLDRPTSFDA